MTLKLTSLLGKINPAKLLCLWLVIFPAYACEDKIGQYAMNSSSSCKLTPVSQSQQMIRRVLDDLSTSYSHEGGGGISEIKQIATNTFRISIAQEERIDQITYSLEINDACEVKILNKEISAISPWENS